MNENRNIHSRVELRSIKRDGETVHQARYVDDPESCWYDIFAVKGKAMNWTGEAYAEAARRDRADTDWYALSAESLFAEGAEWMRNQLRTPEAVERVANFLHNDDHGETIDEHEATCDQPAGQCLTRGLYMDYARAAIDALIGGN